MSKTFAQIMGVLMMLSLFSVSDALARENEVERQAIIERITPTGQLCVQGQACGPDAPPPEVAASEADAPEAITPEEEALPRLDGEALYSSAGCAACHRSGIAGAPVLGDSASWVGHLDKGMETLYEGAIRGIGAMPARGGNPRLSDEEIEAIVDYMVEQVE